MSITTLFINQFQKGAEENANLGVGTMLGVENYTVKGVARLTKDTTKVSGSVVTDLPIYYANKTEAVIYSQGQTGKVYTSTDYGSTWSDITNGAGYSTGLGKGLVYFDDNLYAFRGNNIEYYNGTSWGVAAFKTGLSSADDHCPFIYPNARGFYFGNGYKLGILRQQTTGTPIDPTNSATYFYSNTIFQLPSIYEITCLSFSTPNLLMMGTKSSGVGNDPMIADIISWDTVSLNLFGSPLRLFSQASAGQAGIKQLVNRNNTLYAVTGGNHAIFETNGTSFRLIDDISLQITSRFIPTPNTGVGTGKQAQAPIFLSAYSQAIAVLGNKLLTAPSASISSNMPSGYGNFPVGVWSEAFVPGGEVLSCEFTLSSGVCVSNQWQIGAIHPSIQNQLLIGWFDGTSYGIDKTDFTAYQSDSSVVDIESQMMEIGTPLEPSVITTIQLNLVRSLMAGQTISVYWRNAFDREYALLKTFTSADGDVQLNNSLKITSNEMNAIKFLQLRIQMATGSPNQAWSPELRNVIITGK